MRRTVSFLLAAHLVVGVALGAGDETSPPKPPDAATGGEVGCTGAGVDVTVRLDYDPDRVGLVVAAYLDVGYGAPLAFPADAKADEIRGRLKSLVPSIYRVAPPVTRGSAVRVAVTTTEPGIPPQDLFRIRFDCPAGAQVRPRDLTCTTDEVGDTAGVPMAPQLARQVRCTVTRVEPAAAASPSGR